MSRVTKSVSLPVELDEIVEKYIEDFSGYVQDCIKKDFSSDVIKMQINNKQKEIEILQSQLNKESGKPKEKENSEKEKFIKNAKLRIKEHLGEKEFSLSAIWNQYKNLFGEKISLDKFTEMIK